MMTLIGWNIPFRMLQGVASQSCHCARSCSAFKSDFVFSVTIGLLLFLLFFYIFKCLTSSSLRGNESATVYMFLLRNKTFGSGDFGSILLFVSVFLSVHSERRP